MLPRSALDVGATFAATPAPRQKETAAAAAITSLRPRGGVLATSAGAVRRLE